MYNLANFKDKQEFKMNQQLPNETGEEYKARINKKWQTNETSDAHKLFNLETKLLNMKSNPEPNYMLSKSQPLSIDLSKIEQKLDLIIKNQEDSQYSTPNDDILNDILDEVQELGRVLGNLEDDIKSIYEELGNINDKLDSANEDNYGKNY